MREKYPMMAKCLLKISKDNGINKYKETQTNLDAPLKFQWMIAECPINASKPTEREEDPQFFLRKLALIAFY